MFESTRLIINKVTNRCNIRCRYCSANATGKDVGKRMESHTFRAAVDFVLDHTSEPFVMWLFHGGEPLLMGWRWLREASRYARQAAAKRGKELGLGLVTNGTLIHENEVQMVLDEKIAVSISIDGPPVINDIYRSGGCDVMTAIDRMRRRGVTFRLLGLINSSNYNRFKEIVDFCMREGLIHTKFNLCYSVGRGRHLPELKPGDAFEARMVLLDCMLQHPELFTEVNLIHQVFKYFSAHLRHNGGCTTIHCAAGSAFLGIRYDGGIFPCGRGDDLGDYWRLGSVLESFHQDSALDILNEYCQRGQRYECYTCKAAKVCDYHCPAYMISSFKNRSLDCGVSHLLLNYLDGKTESEKQSMLGVLKRAHASLPHNFKS